MSYTHPTASGIIFSFITSGYIAPTGSGIAFSFTSTQPTPTIYQIWTDDTYVYAAVNWGLYIYEVSSESLCAYVSYSGGFTTVWASDERVFVGTADDGIKYINKPDISGDIENPINLSLYLEDISNLTAYHNLTSTDIRYIHGNGSFVLCTTDSGVDVVKIDPQSYRSYTTVSGAQKCFMTSKRRFYYTVSRTSSWSLNVVHSCLSDWTVPDDVYETGTTIFAAGININDIFITEGTVGNTIFVATSSGVYVIDEEALDYVVYYITN